MSERAEYLEMIKTVENKITEFSTFDVEMINATTYTNEEGVPILRINLVLKRNFAPLMLNTFLPTFLLTFINQLTNYLSDYGTLEGKALL